MWVNLPKYLTYSPKSASKILYNCCSFTDDILLGSCFCKSMLNSSEIHYSLRYTEGYETQNCGTVCWWCFIEYFENTMSPGSTTANIHIMLGQHKRECAELKNTRYF